MTNILAPLKRFLHDAQHPSRAIATAGWSVPAKLLLIILWLYVLWWGERGGFTSRISSCQWDKWEDWPAGATPHHLVLLADPQLIDPHTYPGRPWPLNSATYRHTDQYLRRVYDQLQYHLDPDSILFLGDLLDGGREWSTEAAENPDPQWKHWGQSFWLSEYDRWGRIFLRGNDLTARHGNHPRGDRRFVASLPGNHDLGISKGVRVDVRNRFKTYFGEGNRLDIIGNHSFVSVDSVSLLAKALDPAQEKEKYKDIWTPTSEFLDGVKKQKAQAMERYLAGKAHQPENPRMEHAVLGLNDPKAKKIKTFAGQGVKADVPTILLTHVPLYRDAGTPCGPLREKYPPTKGLSDVNGPIKDERNALSLSAGYQYQNVLFPDISKELIEKIGNVVHVFSGDDHDYCEVVHKGYSSLGGGIREITVKSMSWAMGVRKPGFLLVSLWNPVDEKGERLVAPGTAGSPTIQTKLCIQPDTLGTFIGYGQMFLLTMIVLGVVSYAGLSSEKSAYDEMELPLYKSDALKSARRAEDFSSGSASSNSSDSATNGARARGKSLSARDGWGTQAGSGTADTYSPYSRSSTSKRSATKSSTRRALDGFRWHLLQVGGVGFLFYCWLAYKY